VAWFKYPAPRLWGVHGYRDRDRPHSETEKMGETVPISSAPGFTGGGVDSAKGPLSLCEDGKKPR